MTSIIIRIILIVLIAATLLGISALMINKSNEICKDAGYNKTTDRNWFNEDNFLKVECDYQHICYYEQDISNIYDKWGHSLGYVNNLYCDGVIKN